MSLKLDQLPYYQLLPVYLVRQVGNEVFITLEGGSVIRCPKDHPFVQVGDNQPGMPAESLRVRDRIWVDLQDIEGDALSQEDQRVLNLLNGSLDRITKRDLIGFIQELREAYFAALIELQEIQETHDDHMEKQ